MVNSIRIAEKVNERWEICVSLSEGQFQQVYKEVPFD